MLSEVEGALKSLFESILILKWDDDVLKVNEVCYLSYTFTHYNSLKSRSLMFKLFSHVFVS